MLPKSKIRLARHLRAQTTPYPNVSKWVKRGALLLILVLLLGTYLVTKKGKSRAGSELAQDKQILGEQDQLPQFEDYTVSEGDTLFTISLQFEVDWDVLAELNGLSEPYVLKIGQELKIPKQ